MTRPHDGPTLVGRGLRKSKRLLASWLPLASSQPQATAAVNGAEYAGDGTAVPPIRSPERQDSEPGRDAAEPKAPPDGTGSSRHGAAVTQEKEVKEKKPAKHEQADQKGMGKEEAAAKQKKRDAAAPNPTPWRDASLARRDCLHLDRSNPLVWVNPDYSASENQFFLAAREWVRRYPPPSKLEGIMVGHLFRSTKIVGYLTLMARAMLPRGIVPIVLDSPIFRGLWDLPPEVEALHGIIEHPERQTSRIVGDPDALTFSIWSCDWVNKKILADDLNLYSPIKERLGKAFRCYNIDIDNEKVQKRLINEINLADVALEALHRAVAAADKYDLDVYCTGHEPNYTPTAAYYFYCRDKPRADPSKRCDFIQMNEAYDNYFTGGKMGLISAFTAENLTQNKHMRSPQYMRLDMFEAWLNEKAQYMREEIEINAEECLTIKRVAAQDDGAAAARRRITEWKKAGGSVALLTGKGTFDLGNWDDGGLVHEDLPDWLNHTVDAVRGTETLLVIKPHPTELLVDYYGIPNEYFVDLIKTEVPDNVFILNATWFNLAELLEYADLLTLWTGTSAIEAHIKGVPVFVGSHWRDFPLEFEMPPTREAYRELLSHPKGASVSEEARWRAAAYLYAMRIGPHRQPLPYLHQISKKKFEKEQGKPRFVDAEMERYIREGDQRITDLVGRIFR